MAYKLYDLKLQERKNLTVPVIIKQLETIEASINANNNYSRRYGFTKTQNKILGLYDIKEDYIDNSINDFNKTYNQ